MEDNGDEAYIANRLPPGCWHHVLQHFDAPALARAASVNQAWKKAAYDSRLWYPHFKSGWSPEHYVSPISSFALSLGWGVQVEI
jgi:hypothetical protein